MNDASVRVELNTSSNVAEAMTNGMRPLAWPTLPVPPVFGSMTKQGIARVKESNEKLKTASTEMTDMLRAMYPIAAKGAADYAVKVIELTNANTTAACNFFGDLLDAKSLPDAIKLSTGHMCAGFNTVSAQNTELWKLAHKAATETADPIRQGFTTVLRKPT